MFRFFYKCLEVIHTVSHDRLDNVLQFFFEHHNAYFAMVNNPEGNLDCVFFEPPECSGDSRVVLGIDRFQEATKPQPVDVYLQDGSVSLQHIAVPLLKDVSHQCDLSRTHALDQVQLQLEMPVVDGFG